MRYKIKRIRSRRLMSKGIAFAVCLLLYAFCFAVGTYYNGAVLPEWMYTLHI